MFPESELQVNRITEVGFLIFPGFPMACLTSMIEPLRAANEIANRKAFGWTIVSETGARVTSSAAVTFDPDLPLSMAEGIDYLFLLSSPAATFTDRKPSEGHLRRLSRHGTALGGVSGGVFPLARSGLLDGRLVSVHWCYETAFTQAFPDLRVSSDVILFDHPFYTVSGADAAFDLMLDFIERRLGPDIATEVACWFQHPVVRGRGVRQKTPTFHRPDTADTLVPPVAKAIDLLGDRLADPVPMEDVAAHVGISPRQLERLFKKATGKSPSRYYRTLRMKAARQLVLYTRDPMVRIAAGVGYETVPPLVRHYRAEFGVTPAEDRRTINRFRVEDNRPLPSV